MEPTVERPVHSGAPALVGRDAEMARFADLLAAGRGGIVLHGPAGAGKTRLAEELVAAAERRGVVGRFVRGRTTMEDLPLGAFATLLPDLAQRVDGVSLLVLMRTSLLELAADGRLVLGVDDVHLLDSASASLVHQLVMSGSVLLVATVRDGEWVPDAISELWRDGHLERWPVRPLDAAATVELAVALLDGSTGTDEPALPEGVADELVRLSGGNPLFAVTLARALTEVGPTSSTDRLARSQSLVDFVGARLAGLDPAARDGLAVVALGEPLGVAVVERLVEPTILQRLERGGWLTVTESGRRVEVRLAHPLYGEVLRGNLSRLLARSVYRELVTVVLDEHGARRRDDVLRVATWSLACSYPLPPERYVAAAQEASAAGDLELAEQFASAAWDVRQDFESGLLLLYLHDAERYQRDREGFLARLDELAEDPSDRAAVAITRSFETMWRLGDLDATLEVLDGALEVMPPGAARDEVLAQRAGYLALCGRVDEARRDVLAVVERSAPRVRMNLAYAERVLATCFGDPHDVVVQYDEIAAAAERVRHQVAILPLRGVLAGMSRPLLQLGEVARAEQVMRDALDASAGNLRLAGTLEFQYGYILLVRGRPAEGMQWARRAAVLQRRHGFRTLERWSQGVVAVCAAHAGDVEAAAAALERVEELSPDPTVVYAADAVHARAVLAALQGDIGAAAAHVRELIETAAADGRRFDEALGWHLAGQFGDVAATVEPLTRLASVHGGMVASFADYARAASDRDAEALGRLCDHLASGGADAFARVCAAQAARLYERAGDGRSSAKWARRARDLAAGADGVLTAGGPVPDLEPLSRREREIAELAALGIPSREIAERLFLSTRTVDNHLSRAYDKLGVTGRVDLAAALAAGAVEAGV